MTSPATQRTTDELQVAYCYCLSHLAHLGERSALKLKKAFPAFESWLQLTPSEREEAIKITLENGSSRIITITFDALIERALTDVKRHEGEGIRVLSIDSRQYPQLLRQIADPPLVLFVKGSIEAVVGNSNVAVVGTRDATLKGEGVASRIAKWLGECGWCVISGLAKGIDSAAHRGALDVRGRTAAVMGTSLDKVYPAENRQLASDILDCGGCWISEVPLWKKFHKSSFVRRDRIQSGISVAVIPVQTDVEGGTMHTVRYAKQQRRLVLCPRPIESERSARQYAGIRDLIETGRALPFSGDEYSKVLESLLNSRDTLLKVSTPEDSGEITMPAASVAEVAKEQPSDETESKPERKPTRKRRSRLQAEFYFVDEPTADKRKKTSRKKER